MPGADGGRRMPDAKRLVSISLSRAGGIIVVSVPSDAELNKQLVRTYTEVVFNERQTGRVAEFLAPDVTWHGGAGAIKGRGQRRRADRWRRRRIGRLDRHRAGHGGRRRHHYRALRHRGAPQRGTVRRPGHRPPDPLGTDERVPHIGGQDRQRSDIRQPDLDSSRRRRPAGCHRGARRSRSRTGTRGHA